MIKCILLVFLFLEITNQNAGRGSDKDKIQLMVRHNSGIIARNNTQHYDLVKKDQTLKIFLLGALMGVFLLINFITITYYMFPNFWQLHDDLNKERNHALAMKRWEEKIRRVERYLKIIYSLKENSPLPRDLRNMCESYYGTMLL